MSQFAFLADDFSDLLAHAKKSVGLTQLILSATGDISTTEQAPENLEIGKLICIRY